MTPILSTKLQVNARLGLTCALSTLQVNLKEIVNILQRRKIAFECSVFCNLNKVIVKQLLSQARLLILGLASLPSDSCFSVLSLVAILVIHFWSTQQYIWNSDQGPQMLYKLMFVSQLNLTIRSSSRPYIFYINVTSDVENQVIT